MAMPSTTTTTTTTTLEQISSDLKLAESKKHELSKTYQDLHSHSSSIFSLTLQWRDLQSHFDAIEASLKARYHELESREKSFEARINDLEARETEFAARVRNLEECLKKATAIEKVKTVQVVGDCSRKRGELRFSVSMDGKGLQSFLNERVDEHEKIGDEVFAAMNMSLDPAKLVLDAIEGFYPLPPQRLSNGGKEFELGVVRRSCVLLLEQLIRIAPQIRPSVREVAKGVASEWKGKMGVEELEVLGFLLLVGVYELAPEFDKDEIFKLFKVVEEYRLVSQLRRLLGITDNISVRSIILPSLKTEQSLPQHPQLDGKVASSSESPWPKLKPFCINMDGNGLRLFLSEHVKEHEVMQSEVYDALRCASDPVKLVLDAIQGINPSNSDRIKRRKFGVCQRSCILLLDQLMRLSPQIEPAIKEVTVKIAVEWKGEFLKRNQKPVKVLGYLQLVATFGLISFFDADELLCLLKNVYQRISPTDLFRVLGLIPKFVQFFIKKKRLLKSLKYIYAFDLVDKFPPVQLLKAHVDYWMFRSRKLCKERHLAQSKATKKEIDALRAVIKCIEDFKLESEYTPDILEKRIKQLEKKSEDGKCEEPTPTSNAEPHMQSGVTCPQTVISTIDAQIAPVSSSSIVHSLQPSASSTIQPNQLTEIKHSDTVLTTSSVVHSLRPSVSSTIHPIQPTSSTIQPNQLTEIKHSDTVFSTSSIVHSLRPSASSTIHPIQPTSSTIQPKQLTGIKHSDTVFSTSSIVHSLRPSVSSTIHPIQPTSSTIQPNQLTEIKHSDTVFSTSSIVHSLRPSASSTIHPIQPTSSTIQPKQLTGIKHSDTVFSTSSIVHSLRPNVSSSSTIHPIQPTSTIPPNQLTGIKHSDTVFSTSSIVHSLRPSASSTIHPIQPTSSTIQPTQLTGIKHSDRVFSSSSIVHSLRSSVPSTIHPIQPTSSTIQPNQLTGIKHSNTVFSTSSIVHSLRPSASSTIHPIQPTSTIQPNQLTGIKHSDTVFSTADTQTVLVSTSITASIQPSTSSTSHLIQPNPYATIHSTPPNQQTGIKHSQTVFSTADTQNAPDSTAMDVSIQPSTSSTIDSIQPSAPSVIHSTLPNQQTGIKHSKAVISRWDVQNDPASTSTAQPTTSSTIQSSQHIGIKHSKTVISKWDSQNDPAGTPCIVLSTQPTTSSAIPSTTSTINSTQPNQQAGINRSRTVISTGEEAQDTPVTTSTIHSIHQNWQAAGMFMNQGAPYSRTSTGYYSLGGSNPYPLHMNSSTGSYAMTGSTLLSSNLGLSSMQYGSGLAANANMGQFGLAVAYPVRMDAGIASVDSSKHYYPSFRPHGSQ